MCSSTMQNMRRFLGTRYLVKKFFSEHHSILVENIRVEKMTLVFKLSSALLVFRKSFVMLTENIVNPRWLYMYILSTLVFSYIDISLRYLSLIRNCKIFLHPPSSPYYLLKRVTFNGNLLSERFNEELLFPPVYMYMLILSLRVFTKVAQHRNKNQLIRVKITYKLGPKLPFKQSKFHRNNISDEKSKLNEGKAINEFQILKSLFCILWPFSAVLYYKRNYGVQLICEQKKFTRRRNFA